MPWNCSLKSLAHPSSSAGRLASGPPLPQQFLPASRLGAQLPFLPPHSLGRSGPLLCLQHPGRALTLSQPSTDTSMVPAGSSTLPDPWQGAGMMSPELRGWASGTPRNTKQRSCVCKANSPLPAQLAPRWLSPTPPSPLKDPGAAAQAHGARCAEHSEQGQVDGHTGTARTSAWSRGKARTSEEVRPQLSPEKGPGAPSGGKSSGEAARP